MAEPTLSVKFDELKAQIAHHLYGGSLDISGTNSTFEVLADPEKEVVKAVVRSGLRQFYNPPSIRQRKAHKWSFLDKTATLILNAPISSGTIEYDHAGHASGSYMVIFSTAHGLADTTAASKYLLEVNGVSYPVATKVDGETLLLTLDANDNPGADVAAGTAYRLHQDDYTLPDDFGRFIGPMTYVEKENAWYSVAIVGEGRIRELRQRDFIGTNGSKPQVAAIRVVNNNIEDGTRREIMFWPAVSDAYVINYRYRVRPQDDGVNSTLSTEIPYGAADHADTILYSCLAEAELRLDERQGVYYQRFLVSLASSIDLDSRTGKPQNLGYNDDRSDVEAHMGREYLFGSRIRHKNFSGTFTD